MYTSAIEIRRRTQGRKPQTEEKKGRKSPKGTHPPPLLFYCRNKPVGPLRFPTRSCLLLKTKNNETEKGGKAKTTSLQMNMCNKKSEAAAIFCLQGWMGAIKRSKKVECKNSANQPSGGRNRPVRKLATWVERS